MWASAPACGNVEAHEPHLDVPTGRDCSGVPADEAACRQMCAVAARLAGALRWEPELLAAFRLRCHPAVISALHQSWLPSFTDLSSGGSPDLVSATAGLPVEADSQMPAGTWQLIAAEGEVPS